MKLNQQQLDIICPNETYSCILTKNKFAHAIFQDKMLPYGNLITFKSSVALGKFNIPKALVFCGELLNVNLFGAAAFQRLFSVQLGSLLSMLTNKSCFIDEGSMFVEDKQLSITLLNQIKDSCVFHIILFIKTEQENFCNLELDDKQLETFEANATECFNQLTKSLFLETQRDNL